MSRVVPFRTDGEQAAAAPEVAGHLRRGGLITCPTETVYGFGCALRPRALEALRALKQRGPEKPFLLLVTDTRIPGVRWTPAALDLAARFWPGPLTIVLQAEPGAFPAQVLGGNDTVAVRATSHPGLRRVLEALGEPMTSTSANVPGEAPATTLDQARAVLSVFPAVDDMWLLDGGTLPPSLPSTIIDGTVQPPRLIRRGALDMAQLAEIPDGIELRAAGL